MSASNAHNLRTWAHHRFVVAYSSTELRPLEADLLERYADDLRGHVLELGCGTGRLTLHLVGRAERVDAIDLSEAMVERCRTVVPEAQVHCGDMTDLSAFDDGAFGAVVAGCNVLDVLDDTGRRALLGELHRVLAPGGLLLFSSHNRDYAPRLQAPWRLPTHRLLAFGNALVRLPVRTLRHVRLRRHEVRAPDFAILNDSAHDYALLHYYIAPPAQRAQLTEHGFALLECLTLDGRDAGAGVDDVVELHYVARSDQ